MSALDKAWVGHFDMVYARVDVAWDDWRERAIRAWQELDVGAPASKTGVAFRDSADPIVDPAALHDLLSAEKQPLVTFVHSPGLVAVYYDHGLGDAQTSLWLLGRCLGSSEPAPTKGSPTLVLFARAAVNALSRPVRTAAIIRRLAARKRGTVITSSADDRSHLGLRFSGVDAREMSALKISAAITQAVIEAPGTPECVRHDVIVDLRRYAKTRLSRMQGNIIGTLTTYLNPRNEVPSVDSLRTRIRDGEPLLRRLMALTKAALARRVLSNSSEVDDGQSAITFSSSKLPPGCFEGTRAVGTVALATPGQFSVRLFISADQLHLSLNTRAIPWDLKVVERDIAQALSRLGWQYTAASTQ